MGAATHAIRLKRRFGQSPCKTVNAVFERSENSVFDEENMLELVISHTTATDKWIRRHHYLHSTPAGAVIRMEFWIPVQETAELCSETELSGEKCLVGAMLWGRPVSPQIDQKHILELTRCCFLDVIPPNTESFCLAKARAWIRKPKPEIKGLIAYASTAEHHGGTIYLADGWFKVSETKSVYGSWENRPGRMDRDLSKKLKFARSP